MPLLILTPFHDLFSYFFGVLPTHASTYLRSSCHFRPSISRIFFSHREGTRVLHIGISHIPGEFPALAGAGGSMHAHHIVPTHLSMFQHPKYPLSHTILERQECPRHPRRRNQANIRRCPTPPPYCSASIQGFVYRRGPPG